jgi:hypothetical protein
LNLKKDQNQKYIILYRSDPICQFESIYRFTKRNESPNYSDQETFNELLECYRNGISYYHGFKLKWLDNTSSNILLIDYKKICECPSSVLNNILIFLGIRNISVFDTQKLLLSFEEILNANSLEISLYKKIMNEVCSDSNFEKLSKAITKLRLNNINKWNIKIMVGYLFGKY